MRSTTRRNVRAEHVLDLPPRLSLVAQKMQRKADHAITNERIGGVRRTCGHFLEPPRKSQRVAEFFVVQVVGPEAPERLQLVVDVTDAFGNLPCAGPRRLDFRSEAFGIEQRRTQRRKELHIAARTGTDNRAKARERLWTRPRHSSIRDRCIQSGTAAIVSNPPSAESPTGENAQSRAARTLST